MENIHKKFPRMDDKDRQKIFKEFLLAAEGEEEIDHKFRRDFYNKLNSNTSDIRLTTKENIKEFFENHYTLHNLLNPKSQGISCNRVNVGLITQLKIKSRRSNNCIMAFKEITLPDNSVIGNSGFENYANYLLNILTNLFPKNRYFNKFDGNRLMEMYLNFFPD